MLTVVGKTREKKVDAALTHLLWFLQCWSNSRTAEVIISFTDGLISAYFGLQRDSAMIIRCMVEGTKERRYSLSGQFGGANAVGRQPCFHPSTLQQLWLQ